MDQFTGKKLALLSVTDKSGLVEFARGLTELGYVLLSTGGTAKLLRDARVPVRDVSEYTGQPEILDGRVKTLHPKVHGGILFDRANRGHAAEAAKGGITPIDLVVVNLYRFAEEAVAKGLPRDAAIEHIDIGGPTMLRAAAKNWVHTLPVIDPADYDAVLAGLRAGDLPRTFRQRLAAKTFAAVSAYDAMIAGYLAGAEAAAPPPVVAPTVPASLSLPLRQLRPLRYGENPHQAAGLYADASVPAYGFAALEVLAGKELSYNNILDLDAATALCGEFDGPAAVVVKHTNPCGVALARDGESDASLAGIFRRALACDPKSAFGGIVALNRKVDKATAEAVTSLFTECVAAPDFAEDALAVLRQKANLRVVKTPLVRPSATELQIRSIRGGFLVQTVDAGNFDAAAWKTVTRKAPSPAELSDLRFAMIVAKHVKSNSVVFVKDGTTVGIGAGQMSRIDSANTAVAKAKEEGHTVEGTVMASEAFFPFRDTVDFAARHGVRAIVQPGGSKKDGDSIAAADEQGLAMVFTGERHFKH